MERMTREDIAQLPPPSDSTPEERAAAALPQPPPGHRPAFSHVGICLTPHAYVPNPCPPMWDQDRWVNTWKCDPRFVMLEICTRLGRAAEDLLVVDDQLSGDVEIHGLIRGYDKFVPLALIGFGLTADQAQRGLESLARTPA